MADTYIQRDALCGSTFHIGAFERKRGGRLRFTMEATLPTYCILGCFEDEPLKTLRLLKPGEVRKVKLTMEIGEPLDVGDGDADC